MKLSDVRMRGRGFTLGEAVREMKVSMNLVDAVLDLIYYQGGMFDEAGNYLYDFVTEKERNQPMSTTFTEEVIGKRLVDSEKVCQDLVQEGLLIKTQAGYEVSQKMMSVLERAAQIQKELDDRGFICRPCCSKS